MTQKDVEDMFTRYGRIINSRVLVDQTSGEQETLNSCTDICCFWLAFRYHLFCSCQVFPAALHLYASTSAPRQKTPLKSWMDRNLPARLSPSQSNLLPIPIRLKTHRSSLRSITHSLAASEDLYTTRPRDSGMQLHSTTHSIQNAEQCDLIGWEQYSVFFIWHATACMFTASSTFSNIVSFCFLFYFNFDQG